MAKQVLMRSLQSKRFFCAIEKTIFIGACIHLTIKLVYSILTGKYVYLNMASILDLKFIFPDISYTATAGILSSFPLLGIFFYFYFRRNKELLSKKE